MDATVAFAAAVLQEQKEEIQKHLDRGGDVAALLWMADGTPQASTLGVAAAMKLLPSGQMPPDEHLAIAAAKSNATGKSGGTREVLAQSGAFFR